MTNNAVATKLVSILRAQCKHRLCVTAFDDVLVLRFCVHGMVNCCTEVVGVAPFLQTLAASGASVIY